MKTLKEIYKIKGLTIRQFSFNSYNKENTQEIKAVEGKDKIYKLNDDIEFFMDQDLVNSAFSNFKPVDGSYKQNPESKKDIEDFVLYSSKIEGEDYSDKNIKDMKKMIKNSSFGTEGIENKIKIKLISKNAQIAAVNYLHGVLQIKKGLLFDLYNILTNGGVLLEEENKLKNGKFYRDSFVGIFDGMGTKIMDGISVDKIDESMENIFTLMNNLNKTFSTISEAIAVTHIMFETVHPYFDFNGRIGRILIWWIMQLMGPMFPSSFVMRIIEKETEKYMTSMMHSQRTRNIGYFASFIHEVMECTMTMKNISYILQKMITPTNNDIQFILELYLSGMWDEPMGYSKLKGDFVVTRKAFDDKMNKLASLGVIDKTRKKNAVLYKFSNFLIEKVNR